MNDDLDEEIIEADDGFDEFAQKSGIADVISRSPVAKIILVAVVLGLVGFVAVMFSGEEEEEKVSIVAGGSDVTAAPGTDQEVSPAYIAAVEEQNEVELDKAIAEGTSAIPVPIDTPDTRLEVPEVEEETEDPLHRWRMLQEERVERQMKSRAEDSEPVTVLDAEQQSEAITSLAESMMQQMESVLTTNNQVKSFTTKTLINYNESDDSSTGAGQGNGAGGQGGSEGNFEEEEDAEVIVPAGTVYYGQLLLQANSDVPFTVLAQIVSGPLRGWKLLGKFSVIDELNLLGIKFSSAVNDEGKQYRVRAVMLNPENGLAAMRTGVDHRYLRRIVLPMAAEFISGYASAIAESGRTSVTVTGQSVVSAENPTTDKQQVATGVQGAADEIASLLEDYGDTPVKIVIDAGTPIGIFFTRSVLSTDEGVVATGGL